ncbi:hypothetical protein B0H34DRAFT_737 [Crassisporium funariophilum]|nr:hypothetical protein B0H34DRAFT_737 [Crassisporium funariophilum]
MRWPFPNGKGIVSDTQEFLYFQCQAWYIFLFVSSLVLMAVFDGILLLRVYALYSKSIKVSLVALPVALHFAILSLLHRTKHLP